MSFRFFIRYSDEPGEEGLALGTRGRYLTVGFPQSRRRARERNALAELFFEIRRTQGPQSLCTRLRPAIKPTNQAGA
jgi:hypothetical protein